jgi:ATP-dependent DNA ligase
MTKLAQAAKRIRSACPHHIITSWQDRIVMPFAISTSFLPLTPARRPAGARRTRNLRKNAYLRSMLKAFDFCIPTRGTKVPDRADWLHEIKYDGYRCASNAMATVYD